MISSFSFLGIRNITHPSSNYSIRKETYLWKALLPRDVTLTLNPTFDPQKQQLRCAYQIDSMPLLEWIAKQVVKIMGNVTIEHIKVTPNEIILSIPNQDHPYTITNITVGDITIQLKKE
jgi:hypothetical protein